MTTTIPVYIIERDNGDGRLVRRHSLTPLGAACVHHANDLGHVTHDDLDGGLAGHLTLPDGARAVETNYNDDAIYYERSRLALPIDDAVRVARRGPNNYGLGWSSAV